MICYPAIHQNVAVTRISRTVIATAGNNRRCSLPYIYFQSFTIQSVFL